MPVVTKLASLLGKGTELKPIALKDNTLRDIIIKADRVPNPPRTNPKGYIHISSLINGTCPRLLSLKARFDIQQFEFASGATRIMWEIGRAVERHIRAQIIASLPAHQVYGQWKCPCHDPENNRVGRTREGFAEDKGKCVRCGWPAMIYVELDLESDIFFVTGHPDLILIFHGCIVPVEIKSLTNSESANKKNEGYDTITKPFVDHVLQVSSYHRMLVPLSKRLGLPLAKHSIILYAGKDFKGFQEPYPYKEFHPSPFEHKEIVQDMFLEGQRIFNGSKGLLPPKLIKCKHRTDPIPGKCPLADQCFSLTHGLNLKAAKVRTLRE